MVVMDGEGVPIGGGLASASPAEVTLLEETIETIADLRLATGALSGGVLSTAYLPARKPALSPSKGS